MKLTKDTLKTIILEETKKILSEGKLGGAMSAAQEKIDKHGKPAVKKYTSWFDNMKDKTAEIVDSPKGGKEGCPDGQKQVGTKADDWGLEKPVCAPDDAAFPGGITPEEIALRQTQSPGETKVEPLPKPKRFAGMSVKYLERRGYVWDPIKQTMMHPKKGDVRDVKKRWKKIVARRKKRRERRKKQEYPAGQTQADRDAEEIESKTLQENKQTNTDLLTESEIKRFVELFNK